MKAVRNLVLAILLLACTGCLTKVRPSVSGQVIDATTGQPVHGVDVTIHYAEVAWTQLHSDKAIVQANSDEQGKFLCKGSVAFGIWSGYRRSYQVRFHRNGYRDSKYDFLYQVDVGLLIPSKEIGKILLHPRSQTGPSEMSDVSN